MAERAARECSVPAAQQRCPRLSHTRCESDARSRTSSRTTRVSLQAAHARATVDTTPTLADGPRLAAHGGTRTMLTAQGERYA